MQSSWIKQDGLMAGPSLLRKIKETQSRLPDQMLFWGRVAAVGLA